eukprot:403350016
MKDSSVSMTSSAGSSGGGKAIKVTPEELTFENIYINQTQIQQLTLRNNLSAPVEINLKSSNPERFDIEPKTKKLVPFETFTLDVIVKVLKPFAQKSNKHKEQIFIKSDFFDQKVVVILMPAPNMNSNPNNGSISSRDNSLQSSMRNPYQFTGKQKNRDTSREGSAINFRNQASIENDEGSSPRFQQKSKNTTQSKSLAQTQTFITQLEKDLQERDEMVQELSQQLRKQEIETQNTLSLFQQEQSKRKELEERLNVNGLTQSQQDEEIMTKFKQLLREREPNLEQLMDLTLKKERDQQERKDAKILDILKIKDRQIEELQTRTVQQEGDYGKLAQMFQEQKRNIRAFEDRENTLMTDQREMEQRIENLQAQLDSFQRGKEYQKLLEMEDQLKQANDYIQTCQQELLNCQTELQEKSQVESFFDEAVNRYKEQLKQQDIRNRQLEVEVSNEKELRIREEEHLKSVMAQLNQVNNTSLQERDMQNQFLKQEREYIDRINKLQQDKQMLLEEVQTSRDERDNQEQVLREALETITQLVNGGQKYKATSKKANKNVSQQLSDKINELARQMKEINQENQDFTQQVKTLTEKLSERKNELQQVIDENQESKDKQNKKIRTQGRSIQTSIELEDMDLYTDQKQRFDQVIEENLQMQRYCQDLESKFQRVQSELDGKNQELMFLVKSSNKTSHHPKNSFTTISDVQNQSTLLDGNQHEELISRLNSKITQMKLNEDQLQQELQMLRQQMEGQQQLGGSQINRTGNQLQSSSIMAIKHNSGHVIAQSEERISEYEIIMLDQRQQLLKLTDENVKLKHQLTDLVKQNELEQEEMKIRLKNMSELKDKHEQINQMLQSQQTESGYFGGGMSNKSTALETERMRQYVQQLELGHMQLKHQCEELKKTLQITQSEFAEVKQEYIKSELLVNRLKNDMQLSKVGLLNSVNNANGLDDSYGQQENKLTQTVIEQRNKIKYLQGLLIRAKQDFDKLRNQTSNTSNNSNQIYKNHEEVQKSNEKMRREHQQAIMMVVELREEYASKLMIFADKHEQQRNKLKQENLALTKKFEHIQQQITYMEKKEMRLYSQLEEARSLQEEETREKESRTKELEELLFKKEETINDLSREIKSKEKIVQDSQEQIAILIGTLENEHSQDESRQKVLNLTAELCSQKAIMAQAERKLNEMNHMYKKNELSNAKLQKSLEMEKSKSKSQSELLNKLEKSQEDLNKKVQDLNMALDDKERELNDQKFQNERHQFQFQLKEESVSQMKEQVKRQEAAFKEEVERVRKEMQEKVMQMNQALNGRDASVMRGTGNNDSMVFGNVTTNLTLPQNKTLQLKTAIQQLHLVVSDFLNSPQTSYEKGVVAEFEKALSVASNHIDKLNQNLDQSHKLQALYQSDMRASTLNKQLINQNESLQIKMQKIQNAQSQREGQREAYFKLQQQQWQKIVRELELKNDILNKENVEMESELTLIRDKFRQCHDQKEELEQSLFMFEQEQEIKRQSMERKAELTVDERFKSKHESIKAYFDSNITRILLNTQNSTNDKIVDLGRDILSQKLLIEKLLSQIDISGQEQQSLDLNLAHYKELAQTQEQRLREIQIQLGKVQSQLYQQDLKTKIEIEKKKQEIITLEKDLLRTREQAENKTRESIQLQEQLNSKEQNSSSSQNTQAIENLQQQTTQKDSQTQSLQTQLEELQEKLVDSRTQHIHELDDLKVQYDLELAEQKRNLAKEKEQLDKKFMPGYAPGDLMEHNQDLQNRIIDLKNVLDRIMQENVILRKKCEGEKFDNENQRSEIHSYKQALMELESTMIEITNAGQSQIKEQLMRSTISKAPEEKKKLNISNKKKGQLHFNKDVYQSESDQYSHSKINHHEQSSLNVSALTSVNMIHNSTLQRPSSSIGNYTSTGNSLTQKTFLQNPPQLVKALIQAKVSEMLLKKKCEDLAQVEVDLRMQLKELQNQRFKDQQQLLKSHQPSQDLQATMNTQYLMKSQQIQDYEFDQLKRRVIELEIECEDLKITKAQDQVQYLQLQQQQALSQIKPISDSQIKYHIQDYNTLIETVIVLINQLSSSNDQYKEQNQRDQQTIEDAQRLVIKSLAQKVLVKGDIESLSYVPSDDKDKQLWYLELLEQQVNTSEQVIQQLQSFIKKLQIDISGNLQSAAQIKAASMDLAQNTMKTSDEVKTLKHIVGLIKHDLNRQFQQQQQQEQQNTQQQPLMSDRPFNPFEKQQTLMFPKMNQTVSSQQFEQLYQKFDNVQNQLSITEKVKKTLEQEIVQLKINHSQELQSMSYKLDQTTDQRNSLLQTNEELHSKVAQLQNSLDKLKNEIFSISEENTLNHTILMEKEKEKQIMAQTKTATSKHLQKLQQDMREWRQQTDDNMKVKDKQIGELAAQVSALSSERDRLKSENQMLRRNEKDRKSNVNQELQNLEQENKQLIDRLNQEMNQRKQEIEYWVTERATMREMIDQLESEKVEQIVSNDQEISPKDNKKVGQSNNSGKEKEKAEKKAKDMKKKLEIKLKQKEVDLRQKEKQLQDLNDELSKLKIINIQLEQKVRETSLKQNESDDRVKYMNSKVKEIELERDLILAEKQNALQSNDISSYHIQQELNSLRECFAKLKVERDNLLYEIDSTHQREQEWKSSVEKLSEEMNRMEKQVGQREKENTEHIRVLETKNTALLADLKYLKVENDRLKDKSKDLDQSQLSYEQKLHQEQIKNQELQFQLEEQKRYQNDFKNQLRGKDQTLEDIQQQLLLVESQKMKEIQDLKSKIDEVKEANAQLISLYENQIQDLRTRFVQDKKRTEQQVDNMFSIAQRDAVVKSLKKELSGVKSQLTKSKQKNKDLKQQLQNQENIQAASNKPLQRRNPSSLVSKNSFKDNNIISELDLIDKNVVKLAQMLQSEDQGGYRGLLEQLQKTNSVLLQSVEMKAELEKTQNWNLVISQQLQEQIDRNVDLSEQIESVQKNQVKESKMQKSQNANSEAIQRYKLEIRQLQNDLEAVKEEWLSPADAKILQDKLRESQNQQKSLKEEVQRKRDVINQMKQQQNQTEVEANQILADMEGLKDDNVKLQKLIRENQKNQNAVKELKSQAEFMKVQEKRLKEEITILQEKIKAVKLDLGRKDQLVKEYKDKLDSVNDEVGQTNQKQNEIERLKEITKKLKLETEIKDNQVKALKQRLEHNEEELENLRTMAQSQSQTNISQSSQLENQIKLTKSKIKKYECYLKKSLEAIKKIGKELSQQNSKMSHIKSKSSFIKPTGKRSDNAMEISEFDKDFYKDSVNILGVSMDELEEFMNPSMQLGGSQSNVETQNFIAKLDRVTEIPETLNQDIEQICNYCVKLIQEINPDIAFK